MCVAVTCSCDTITAAAGNSFYKRIEGGVPGILKLMSTWALLEWREGEWRGERCRKRVLCPLDKPTALALCLATLALLTLTLLLLLRLRLLLLLLRLLLRLRRLDQRMSDRKSSA